MVGVYLSVPLIKNRNLTLAKIIADSLRSKNLDITSDWVLSEDPGFSKEPEYVYKRDISALAKSRILVADVSTPSIGVGMEIMYAKSLDIPIICLQMKGGPLSRMLIGMPGKTLIQYDNVNELINLLSDTLESMIRKTSETRK